MSIFGAVCKGVLWAADPGASLRRSSTVSHSSGSRLHHPAEFGQLYKDTLGRAQRYRRYHKGPGNIGTILSNCAVNNSDLEVALRSAIAFGDKAAIGIINRMKRLSTNERVNIVRSSE